VWHCIASARFSPSGISATTRNTGPGLGLALFTTTLFCSSQYTVQVMTERGDECECVHLG
jgi:hypothetical protein